MRYAQAKKYVNNHERAILFYSDTNECANGLNKLQPLTFVYD